MDAELRLKKLASGKEKLAAFRNKKAKKSNVKNDFNNESYGDLQQRHQEAGLPDFSSSTKSSAETSPREALSLSDSELCSLTSDDEHSDEEARPHIPFTVTELENAMDGQHIIEEMIHIGESSQWNDLSHVESAISQRDELLSQLASSLKFIQELPTQTDEFTTQLYALAQHICLLKTKLNQANQDLQEQLLLHESSMISLQAAKAQILQLQMIIIKKDEKINSISQALQLNSDYSMEALKLKDETIHQCQSMLQTQSAQLEIFKYELEAKVAECQHWTAAQEEWTSKEQNLMISINSKTEDHTELQKSFQSLKLEEAEMLQKCELLQAALTEKDSDNRLQKLEQELVELRSVHKSDSQEIARLQKRNHELESNIDDHSKRLSYYQCLQQDYEHIMNQHSGCLSQLENLNSLNVDLQQRIHSLGQADHDIHVLKEQFDKLRLNYESEFQKRSELEIKLLNLTTSSDHRTVMSSSHSGHSVLSSYFTDFSANNSSNNPEKELNPATVPFPRIQHCVLSGSSGEFVSAHVQSISKDACNPQHDTEDVHLTATIEDLKLKLKTSETVCEELAEKLKRHANENFSSHHVHSVEENHFNNAVIELLQAEINTLTLKVQTQEADLSKTTSELAATKDSLHSVQLELTLAKHDESKENRDQEHAVHAVDDTYYLQLVQQQLSEKEAAQEELQSQLESTITQWQRLQLIVQEKEIEVQNLQENLDEQKRICSNMSSSHQEYIEVLQSEIDLLKLRLEEYQEKFFNMENESLHIITERNSLQNELERVTAHSQKQFSDVDSETSLNNYKTNQTVLVDANMQTDCVELKIQTNYMDSETQFNSVSADFIQREGVNHTDNNIEESVDHLYQNVTIEELKQLIIQKDSVIFSLQLAMSEKEMLTQELQAKVLNIESELFNAQANHDDMVKSIQLAEEKLAKRDADSTSASKKATAQQLKLKASKKQIAQKEEMITDLSNKLAISQEQFTDLSSQKEEIITDLNNKLAETQEQISDLSRQKEEIITDLNNKLANSQEQISDLSRQLAETNSELSELLGKMSKKEETQTTVVTENLDSLDLQHDSIRLKDDQISNLTEQLLMKNSEIAGLNTILIEKEKTLLLEKDEMCSAFINKDCEQEEHLTVIKKQLLEKETEITILSSSVAEKIDAINILNMTLSDNEGQITALKNSLLEKQSDIDFLQEKVGENEELIKSVQGQLAVKVEEIDRINKQISDMGKDVSDLSGKLSDKDSQIVGLQNVAAEEVSHFQKTISERDDELSLCNQKLQESCEEIVRLNCIIAEKGQENAVITQQLQDGQSDMSNFSEQLKEKEVEISNASKLQAEKEGEMCNLQKELSEKTSELVEIKIDLSRQNEEMSKLLETVRERDEQLETLQKAFTEKSEYISILTTKGSETDESILVLKDNLIEKEIENSTLLEKMAEKEEAIAKLSHKVDEKTDEVGELSDQLSRQRLSSQKKAGEVSFLNEQLLERDEALGNVLMTLSVRDDLIVELNRKLSELTEDIVCLQGTVSEKDSCIATLTSSLSIIDDESALLKEKFADVSELQNKLLERDEIITQCQSEKINMAASLNQKIEEITELYKNISEKDRQLFELNIVFEEKVEMDKQSSKKDVEMISLRKHLIEKEEEISHLHRLLEEKDEQIKSSKELLSKKESDISSLLSELTVKSSEFNRKLFEKDEEIGNLLITLLGKDETALMLSSKVEACNEEILSLQTLITSKEEYCADLNQRLSDQLKEISVLNESHNASVSSASELKSNLSEKDEEISSLQLTVSEKDLQIFDLDKKLADIESCRMLLQKELEDRKAELSQTQKDILDEIVLLKNLTTEKDDQIVHLQRSLGERDNEIIQMNKTVAERDMEVESLHDTVSEQNNALLKLQKSVDEKDTVIMQLQTTVIDQTAEIASVQKCINDRLDKINLLQKTVESTNEENARLQMTINEKTETFAALQAQLKVETTNETKLLLSAKDEEISRQTAQISEFEMHISNLTKQLENVAATLSQKEEHIILMGQKLLVKDEEIAHSIQLITSKENDIADLYETINNKEEKLNQANKNLDLKDEEIAWMAGVVQEHTEICDGKVLAVQQQLVDNELVIDSLKVKLSEGEELLKKTTEKLVQRDNELDSFQKELHCKETNYDALHLNLEELTCSNQGLNDKIASLKQELSECVAMINDKDTKLTEALNRLMEQEKLILQLEPEKTHTNEQLVQQEIVISDLQDKVVIFESEISNQKLYHHEVVDKLDAKQSALSAQLETLKLALEKKEIEYSNIEQERHQSHSKIIELEAELQSLLKDLEDSNLEKQNFKEGNEQLLSVKENCLQSLDDLQQKLVQKDVEITAISSRLAQEQESCKQLMKSNNDLEKSYILLQSSVLNLLEKSEENQSVLIQQEVKLQEQEITIESLLSNRTDHVQESYPDSSKEMTPAGDIDEPDSKIDILEDPPETKKNMMLSYQLLMNQFLILSEDSHQKDDLLIGLKLELEHKSSAMQDLSVKLEESNTSLSESLQCTSSLRTEVDALKAECHTLIDNEQALKLKISSLEAEVESQEIISSHHVAECNKLAENVAQLSQDLDAKEKLLIELKQESDSYLKELNDLKAELEIKSITENSLKEAVESLTSSLNKSQEERELLKANFDSCMEDMQQKLNQQELETQRLRSKLAEQTKTVCQGQDQLKDIFELQICQLEEKLLQSEKQGEQLSKDLADSKTKYNTCKDLYEGQLSDLEISLQSANSEVAKLRDQLSKIMNNHECEIAGLKRLHEIQTNELEDSCLSLERNVSELRRQVNEQTLKFNKERNNLEQSLEFQLSDSEEKRRGYEAEISRLRRHLEEMKQDHEMEMRNVEKSCEARMYELEDKCCIATSELERLRKSFSTDGEYTEERHRLDLRIDELETKRRDLEIHNRDLEEEVQHLREQLMMREDELKSLLHSMAEKGDDKSTEGAEEIISLKHQLTEMSREKEQANDSLLSRKTDLEHCMARNKDLQFKIAELEHLVEHMVRVKRDEDGKGKSGLENLQSQINSLSEENSSLKRQLSVKSISRQSLSLKPGVEAICSPYSHISTDYSSSTGDECFSPVVEPEVLEGFVAENPNQAKREPQSNMNNNSFINQEPDFVEEQSDRFQPEMEQEREMDSTNQLNMHPIRENEIHEGFEPETSDLFLIEPAEEPSQSIVWPRELSVGMSPSHHKPAELQFDFSPGGEHAPHAHRAEVETSGAKEAGAINDSTPSNNTVPSMIPSNDMTTTNDTLEESVSKKEMNEMKEYLEEQHVLKMRAQEASLMCEYSAQYDKYKKEMEHHFAQKVQAVRYEWERKFTKALRQMKRDMDKKSKEQALRSRAEQELRSGASDRTDLSRGRLKDKPDIADRNMELGEEVEKLHKENQELAEVRDDLLRQIEISRARGLHDRVQQELQTMLTTRDMHPSPTSLTPTASSPTGDYEESPTIVDQSMDEADGSKSEVSDSSSIRESFLEELEEISHQSGQDLPLEWELTSTETGVFEQEPASIWEVFDGRCARQDCQEVRIRFHKLYQWVVKNQGVGYDEAMCELNCLLGNPLDNSEALKNESIDPSLGMIENKLPSSTSLSDSVGIETDEFSVGSDKDEIDKSSSNSIQIKNPKAAKSIFDEILEIKAFEDFQSQNSESLSSQTGKQELVEKDHISEKSNSITSRNSTKDSDSELNNLFIPEESNNNSLMALQDQNLAEELNLLRRDLFDTKALYCKENTLLQKALLKDQLEKEMVMSKLTCDLNSDVNVDHSTQEMTPSASEQLITEEKLSICMEQISILEDENTSLRSRLRKQEAMTVHLKFQLHQKDQEVIEWQKTFSSHLTTLQKQRSDLVQLLGDKESGKEPFISVGVQEVQRSNSIMKVQEDLLGKIEELDHLYKMLTLRQIELQHCEAERRHLEQMCLLKDFTEIQLMKQKRMMEEHISEIELHLHDREAALREDKNQLLQELKNQEVKLPEMNCALPRAGITSSVAMSAEVITGSKTNPPTDSKVRYDDNEANRQHIKAIEVLRAKLLKEYEIQAANLQKTNKDKSTNS